MNLTDKIRECKAGVIDNPYQGKDKKVLFVCSAGILRSATAARIYAPKYNTRAAGSGFDYALVPVTQRMLFWADEIVFVNQENFKDVDNKFKIVDAGLNLKILNIPDTYEHMHPMLITAFEEQYEPVQ